VDRVNRKWSEIDEYQRDRGRKQKADIILKVVLVKM
jgi:hypothetical protein